MGQRLVLPDPNPCASSPRPPDFCRSIGGGARSQVPRLIDHYCPGSETASSVDAKHKMQARACTHAGHEAELPPLRDPPHREEALTPAKYSAHG
ncbi:hypothetical protein GQ55_5G079900 [Panicum hallii var. hallii]|uniref:Uncharacterized protein n=1 Tax=Panicum hallii var. hallii TaxID=1504633 RepID=A0A2T7DE06_9POAL|nr:hypothetical protein GQ55_5G079900 [Panicum hallii var. hallii]